MEELKRELSRLGHNIKELPFEVLNMALKNGYNIINNHFMAYVDNTKTGYIDHWFTDETRILSYNREGVF